MGLSTCFILYNKKVYSKKRRGHEYIRIKLEQNFLTYPIRILVLLKRNSCVYQ